VKKFIKNIMMIFLLSVFIFPIAVKSLHFHEKEFRCNAKNENHFHTKHEKCAICAYEFSIFTVIKHNIQTQKNEICDNYKTSYLSFLLDKSIFFTYLLRAPPKYI